MDYNNELIQLHSESDTDTNSNRKYYVYRLVDPRTYLTFYVGKGCGDRINQHVNNAKSLMINSDEDEISLKIQQIQEILLSGKQVIRMFHRRGLTKHEALEVEAALIDAYPGLTNIQSGYGAERGLISYDDLVAQQNIHDYQEPQEDYIIIKVTYNSVSANGSLYDAVRRAWKAKLNRASKVKYVLGVIDGIVREVYEVDKWYDDLTLNGRIAFEGKPTLDPISSLKNKRIPPRYRQKGALNPFMYKK